MQKYAEKGSTRFITDDEMRKLFTYLDAAERDGLEHPFLTLAIRLQFEFAARMSEVLSLEWSWINLEQRRVTWPDSKTGDMIKPLSDEAYRLLSQAPRFENSPFVCPSIFDPAKSMTANTYHHGWRRVLKRAGIPHVGTHGIRHRAATDIANSGVPLKVGMALTAHKTVAMFMRYIHNEDDPVRSAAEMVAARRRSVVTPDAPATIVPAPKAVEAEPSKAPEPAEEVRPSAPLPGLEIAKYPFRTQVGNYRPFRHRKGDNRTTPPGSRRRPVGAEAAE